jgi:hypothetical protein
VNIKQAAQVIRDQVTMDQVLSLYGYRTKHGFMCCPFHGEKAPSLKVYKNTGGWHCFGCERGGSVIDFVMEHENCKFNTAVRAIDNALHLNIMNPFEYPEDARKEKRVQDSLDNFVEAVYAYCDALIKVAEITQMRDYKKMKRLEELQYGHAEQLTADDYTFLLTWKENSQYVDYQIEKINEFKEVVAAWRRKARRAI